MQQRFLNVIKVISKRAILQHLYNVLEPLAADTATSSVLRSFEASSFDANLLDSGQVLSLNVARLNAEFRINERVFRDQLAARPDLALSLQERQEENKEAIGNGRNKQNVQPRRHHFAQNEATVLHKFSQEAPADPQALIKSQFYMK